MEPLDILKTVPFFADVLDSAEIEELATKAYFIRFQQGAKPIEEDAPGHAMYIVVSGEADVTVHGVDGPVAKLSGGDIVGEMSLLTGARRSATVTAATPLEVIEVNKVALAHVLKQSPDLVERFAVLIEKRQHALDRLAGGSAWGMMRVGKAEMAATIRSFFANTI
ncbi:MAG: cyclic nucleotide-binding domain-containing protein [Bauldia sp.]